MRLLLGAAVVTGGLVAQAGAANAGSGHQPPWLRPFPSHVTADYACLTTAPVGQIPSELPMSLTSWAPKVVRPGDVYTQYTKVGAFTAPATMAGFQLGGLNNFVVKAQVSGDAKVVGVRLVGGANLGAGKPSVSAAGNTITITVPGSLAPGSSVSLPDLVLSVKAGRSGTVTTTLVGTSYGDPGLTTDVLVPFGPTVVVTLPMGCYPANNPKLATTSIIPNNHGRR